MLCHGLQSLSLHAGVVNCGSAPVLRMTKISRLLMHSLTLSGFMRFLSLQKVAERMRTTVRSLLLLNPDLESQLLAGLNTRMQDMHVLAIFTMSLFLANFLSDALKLCFTGEGSGQVLAAGTELCVISCSLSDGLDAFDASVVSRQR